jgi:hypothetical protein
MLLAPFAFGHDGRPNPPKGPSFGLNPSPFVQTSIRAEARTMTKAGRLTYIPTSADEMRGRLVAPGCDQPHPRYDVPEATSMIPGAERAPGSWTQLQTLFPSNTNSITRIPFARLSCRSGHKVLGEVHCRWSGRHDRGGHRMTRTKVRILLCGFCVSSIAGLWAVAALAAPASGPARSLDEVERAYATKSAAATRQFQEQITAARIERLNGLRSLLDRAMEKKDLETAGRLRDMINSAEAELKADAPPAPGKGPRADEVAPLDKTIRGTVWTWGEETLQFRPDGAAINAVWTAQGLVTSWSVIDRRTVLLYIERGRGHDRYAILTFSPNMDTYSVFGFDGKGRPFPVNRQLKR